MVPVHMKLAWNNTLCNGNFRRPHANNLLCIACHKRHTVSNRIVQIVVVHDLVDTKKQHNTSAQSVGGRELCRPCLIMSQQGTGVLHPTRIGMHGRVLRDELHEDLAVAFLLVSSAATRAV